MGSFKASFFGYRRPEVDAAISRRDSEIKTRRSEIKELRREVEASAAAEAEFASLSGMVIEREREIRGLNGMVVERESEIRGLNGMVVEREREIRGLSEQLLEANERADRSLDALAIAGERMKEVEAQARGQATRIRMKALREAVEIGRHAEDVREAASSVQEGDAVAVNGHADADAQEIFEGVVRVEIGPLGDFAQLVGLENAVSQLGATQISVESFSEGRATLAMNLDEPIDLLRELEEHSPLEFRVRRVTDDNLVLDVDDDPGPEQQAA